MALALHAGYACGRTGVCCRSGWPIPVEHGPLAGLEEALARGRVCLELTPGREAEPAELLRRDAPLPEGAGARLGHDRAGRCLFLETRRLGLCSVHRQLGPQALPVACRQFPRIAVIEPRRVAVSLSHYCPTAAALLAGEGALTPVEAPVALASASRLEGLDARALGARLLRPGTLLDPEAHEEWERRGLALLSSGADPDASVARLAAAAERARRWRAGEGALAARIEAAFGSGETGERGWAQRVASAVRVRDAAPAAWHASASWPGTAVFETAVRDVWRREARLVGRYLAARFFACWALYQGGGLRSHAAWVRLALDTLSVEAARRAESEGGSLDAGGLLEAIRETDRRLLHLADPAVLAEGLEES